MVNHRCAGMTSPLTLSPDVQAVQVLAEELEDEDLSLAWPAVVERPVRAAGQTPPRLVVIPSPYREYFGPFLDHRIGAQLARQRLRGDTALHPVGLAEANGNQVGAPAERDAPAIGVVIGIGLVKVSVSGSAQQQLGVAVKHVGGPGEVVVGSAVAGVDPRVMGIGPVPAVRKLLGRADVDASDIDLVELNEAFASQSLAVIRELGVDREKVNVNGGAIALGHPLGMSGARLVVSLLHELRRRGGRYGLATLCVGVGQGQAALFER